MSLIKNEKLENNKNALEIFIDAKTFQNACQKAYLKQGKRINIPGFRKGKAPKKVIEKLYGADVFYSSAVDLVYPSAVEEAIKETLLNCKYFFIKWLIFLLCDEILFIFNQ